MTLGGAVAPDKALGAFDKRSIAMLLARIAVNGFTMTTEDLQPVGLGLVPLAAMINHADRCAPFDS